MSFAKEYFGQTAGDFTGAEGSSPGKRLTEQHQLQATTTPRKRVVLDYNPITKEISTKFTLKNSSIYAFAFKIHSSFENGYIAKPGLGIVAPGDAFEVTILVNDSQSVGRDLEKDKFTIDLGTVDTDQADNISCDEKRILFIGLSQAAKERLAYIAEEQKRNLQLDQVRSRQRRIMIYIGSGALAVLAVFVTCIDFCAIASENDRGSAS